MAAFTFKIKVSGTGAVTPREVPAPPVAESPGAPALDLTPKIEDE